MTTTTTSSAPASTLAGGGRGEAPTGAGAATRIAVLRAYARGANVADIPTLAGGAISRSGVAAILSDPDVGMSRQRAAAAVRAHDQRARRPVDPVAAVAAEFAPARPVVEVVTPIRQAKEAPMSDIEALLARAEQSPTPKLGRAAARIRTLVAQLRADVETDSEHTAARAEVERLRALLAAAQKRLHDGDPAARNRRYLPSTQGQRVRTADVRAWAVTNGFDCPAMGRLPRAVVDAYRAAHGAAS